MLLAPFKEEQVIFYRFTFATLHVITRKLIVFKSKTEQVMIYWSLHYMPQPWKDNPLTINNQAKWGFQY
eukprot:snap_masked-scaffold_89-processed-gene-0.25-mRNA-1 protein AED:1.00 eAED:1.00 QI:0/0/0/0/1/1/2/0/68